MWAGGSKHRIHKYGKTAFAHVGATHSYHPRLRLFKILEMEYFFLVLKSFSSFTIVCKGFLVWLLTPALNPVSYCVTCYEAQPNQGIIIRGSGDSQFAVCLVTKKLNIPKGRDCLIPNSNIYIWSRRTSKD